MMLRQILRDWSLPIAMISGVVMYLLYVNIPLFDGTHHIAAELIGVVQPLLIFSMLFVTFCKVRYNELKPCRWHFMLLVFQLLAFAGIALFIAGFRGISPAVRVLLEAAMLCLLCPTATAAAVITAKLGGSAASLITYTMLINVSVAVVAPFLITLSHPVEGLSFFSSFSADTVSSVAKATSGIVITVFNTMQIASKREKIFLVVTDFILFVPPVHQWSKTRRHRYPTLPLGNLSSPFRPRSFFPRRRRELDLRNLPPHRGWDHLG